MRRFPCCLDGCVNSAAARRNISMPLPPGAGPSAGRGIHLPAAEDGRQMGGAASSDDGTSSPFTSTRSLVRPVICAQTAAKTRLLTSPELPAGSASSSLEPSCHEPRLGSTIKIRGAQECLEYSGPAFAGIRSADVDQRRRWFESSRAEKIVRPEWRCDAVPPAGCPWSGCTSPYRSWNDTAGKPESAT